MRREVAQALGLPSDEIGPALLDLPETQWYDRKSSRIAPADLAEAIVGFANAEGGTIVIGLRGEEVEGMNAVGTKVNAFRQTPMEFTDPLVMVHVSEVACYNVHGGEDLLLVLEVEPSAVVHATHKDEVFLRVGDQTHRLSFAQRQELIYEKGQAVFDGTLVPGATATDLDWDSVVDYAETLGSADPERLLDRRGLTRGDEVSAAGILLFGHEPQRDFPNAFLRVLRYAGSTRGSGSRQRLVTDVRIEGRIDPILNRAADRVRELQPTLRRLTGSRFEDAPLIPEDAWLEAIVNAVIHRSYSLAGDHIRIEIFDDRIEVTNPGRFPGLAEAANPRDAMRFARNPRIARVCSEIGWSQELGEGIRRMFAEMERAALPGPSYQQTSGSVRVVLNSTWVDPETARSLPAGWQDILAALRQVGGLRTGEVEQILAITRPTALKRLRALEEVGLVTWVGQHVFDPNAYWELSDDDPI